MIHKQYNASRQWERTNETQIVDHSVCHCHIYIGLYVLVRIWNWPKAEASLSAALLSRRPNISVLSHE
jgi:hypothetical protein